MDLTAKALIPVPWKTFFKRKWQRIRPPRIKLTKFIESGCIFEITTKMEKIRVACYGNEADSIKKVLREIQPGDVFYDIGSCLGLYALHAALLGAYVIAFEPDPAYRKRLKRNTQINKLRKSVCIINWAVSDQAGTVTLFTDGLAGNSPSLRRIGTRKSVMVRTDTIDNGISRLEIPPASIIKMDIEGAEILALRGMKELLSSQSAPRLIFIEFHPDFLPQFGSSIEECKRLVEGLSYVEVESFRRDNQCHHFFRKSVL